MCIYIVVFLYYIYKTNILSIKFCIKNCYRNESKTPDETTNSSWKKDGKHTVQNQNTNGNAGSGGDAEKLTNTKTSPRENSKRNPQESVSLTASRTRGRGFKPNANNNMVTNRIVENKSKGRGPGSVTIENRRNNTAQHNDEHQLAHDMKQVNINDGQYHQPVRHNSKFNVFKRGLRNVKSLFVE